MSSQEKGSPVRKPASPKAKKDKTTNSVKSGFFHDILAQDVYRLIVAEQNLWGLYYEVRRDADKAPALAQAWLAAADQLRIAAGQYERLFLEGQE